jgi:hypothetical protein
MSSKPLLTIFAILSALSLEAAAQTDTSREIAALRTEIGQLMQRLERLEQGVAGSAPAAAPGAPAAVPAERVPAVPAERVAAVGTAVRFSGDLRYRHESINEDGEAERHRQRVRGRFGVTADVNDEVQLGLVLATGGDDPVSANQTLDGGFNRKSIGVDRAFFAWQATEQLRISGGKMGNPFFRPGGHHLIFDGDLNPEGLALRYSRGDWFANYAGLWVEERSAADDSILLGGQFGYRRAIGDMRLTAGVSYYDYLETQGQTAFYDGSASGNRLDAFGNYVNDFNIAELFAELELTVADRPLTVFADYVSNTEADAADRGYALGAALGEVTRPGTWRVGYAYQDLEADAVIGTFTDSDFAGGGTDGKGHVVEFGYGLRNRWALGLRYFLNDRGADAGNEHGYNRLQADVSFSY